MSKIISNGSGNKRIEDAVSSIEKLTGAIDKLAEA